MQTFIGFEQALALTLSGVQRCGVETVPLEAAVGRRLAVDVFSMVDSPSLTTSRKDGFAVTSSDLAGASRHNPARLTLTGTLYAGQATDGLRITPGQAVRVTTGAPLPLGADAVIAEEFCRREDHWIDCFNTADPDRNILKCGSDIRRGEPVVGGGEKISPPVVGLLAAAGHAEVDVYRTPRVVVIATGDEVVAPGNPLLAGQLYASNMMEICAWLDVLGIGHSVEIAADRKAEIEGVIGRHLDRADVFLTSGGAWGSVKDLMLEVVQTMDWRGIYHRVRMGPGKAVGFGLLGRRPFFILPGGPPANEMAFLQLALPALMKMTGAGPEVFPVVPARLTAAVSGAKDWANFIHARLEQVGDQLMITPAKGSSRLKSMAQKNAVAILPEGVEGLETGAIVTAQVLDYQSRRVR